MSSLTIVVPALNEEKEVAATVRGLLPVLRPNVEKFELLLIDDGSTDKTGRIMDDLAREIPEAKVIHNPTPEGLGKAFTTGLANATCEYMMLCPSDNAYSTEYLPAIFKRLGEADFICTFRVNQFQSRKFFRFLLSKCFTKFWTTVFGVSARDIQAMNVYRVSVASRVHPTENIGFQMDMTLSLLLAGVSMIQMPISLNPGEYKNKSTAIKLKTLKEIFKTVRKIWSRRRHPLN